MAYVIIGYSGEKTVEYNTNSLQADQCDSINWYLFKYVFMYLDNNKMDLK
jgi:hypothetical protein